MDPPGLTFSDQQLRQGKIMLSGVIFLVQGIKNNLEMFGISQEICVARVDEQGLDIMLADIVRIRFLNVEQILILDALLIGPVPPSDILL